MAMIMISNISPLLVIISSLLLINNVNSQSFQIPTFGQYTNKVPLTLEGDASVINGYLQLSKVVNGFPFPNSAGRASYSAPVHLWDAKSGKQAGFNTSFTFVVEPNGLGLLGDGISFFIAPFSDKIPRDSSGGFLGLFNADSALDVYQNRIVAVEFDSFGNQWDPALRHIGIDINSIASAITVPWPSDGILRGLTAFAAISYEPVAKNLTVSLRYPASTINNGSSINLSFVVDLRTILPEWVRVGFSGATGEVVEKHRIFSWFFSSAF